MFHPNRRSLFGLLVTALILVVNVIGVSAQAQLDQSFGINGRAIIPAQGVAGVEVLPDGRILVLGVYNNDVAVWRFHSYGVLDVSFGEQGRATVDISPGQLDDPRAMKVDKDGRIVIAGAMPGDAFMVVLTPAGSLDSSFSSDGRLPLNFGTSTEYVSHLWIDNNDGKTIYFSANIAGNGWYIGKINPDGSTASGFPVYIGSNYPNPAGIVQDSQGRLVAAASWPTTAPNGDGLNWAVLVRLSQLGILDSTFNGDGIYTFNVNNPPGQNPHTQITDIAIAPDDKIIIANTWAVEFSSIARITVGGSVDPTFGNAGTTILFPTSAVSGQEWITKIIRDSNGNYITAINTYTAPGVGFVVPRLASNGSVDFAFASGGWLTFDPPSAAFDLALEADNDVIVLSTFDGQYTLIRIEVGDPSPVGNPIQNPSFETADSSQASKAQTWTGANLTKDKRTCNTISPPVTYSHTGSCAFLFKGGSGEKSYISQTITPDPSLLTAGTALTLSAWVESPANYVLGKVVVYYTDGTKQAFSVAMGPALAYTQFTSAPFFLAKNASKFKVSFKHTYLSGKLYLDDVALVPNAARTLDGVLPLPADSSASEGWRTP